MSSLPERRNLDHLRKQSKELLRQYRAGKSRCPRADSSPLAVAEAELGEEPGFDLEIAVN
jgi:hypothetical protein